MFCLDELTFDQKVQIGLLLGTWAAGLATLAAVCVSLYLARRGEKVRLRIFVGLRMTVLGDGSPPEEHVCFHVTNLGERPVSIQSVGWVVGKRKKRKYCIQPLSGRWTTQCPAEIKYGQDVTFMVSLSETPNWARDFSVGFINDPSGQSLKTLRAQIFISVGQTFEVKPESGLIDRLRQVSNEKAQSGT